MRGAGLGRKGLPFAGSDRGGERAANIDGLIVTARLNDVDPRAWLLWDAIRHVLPAFNPSECANYFTATGHEPE